MIEVADNMLIKFGGGAASSAVVKLELDTEKNGGKTSFSSGDIINFRLHHDSSVRLQKMLSTAGQVVSQGPGTRPFEAQLLWMLDDDSHDLNYIPAPGLEHLFYGREATGLKKTGSRTVVIGGGDLPALALVKYSATFFLFKLLAPIVELAAGESYPIYIVAYMEDAA